MPDDSSPDDFLKPRRPELATSTKIGVGVLAALFVVCIVSFWLPSPAGWIAGMLLLYAGMSLAVLVVSDLGKLRQDRLQAEHSTLELPTAEDPDLRVMLDARAVTSHQLDRWRAWRRWLGLIVVAAIAAFLFAPGDAAQILPACLLVMGGLRDLQLGVRVLKTLPQSLWMQLSRVERGWLRIQAAIVGLVFLSIWLGVVAVIAYLFSGHIPVRGNTFAFTLFYGLVGLAAMVAGRRWVAMAFAHRPGHGADSIEIERVEREVDPEDGDDD